MTDLGAALEAVAYMGGLTGILYMLMELPGRPTVKAYKKAMDSYTSIYNKTLEERTKLAYNLISEGYKGDELEESADYTIL